VRPFVALLVVLALLASPLAVARPHETRMGIEAEENDRLALDARGQANCVTTAVARLTDDARCPVASTGGPHPATGILVLDALFETHGGVRRPASLAEDPRASRPSYYEGTNLHRSTDGLAPDILVPGPHDVWAWFGFWEDLDGDRLAEYKTVSASSASPFTSETIATDNEWLRKDGARVIAFIEPGSHPQVGDAHRPASYEPDAILTPATAGNPLYESQETFVVIHVDGSLFQVVELRVVTDPRFDHTPTAESFVDIDRHATAAAGPVEALYAGTAAPFVNALGSPSLGYMPNGGRAGPVPFDGTPLAEPSADLYGAVWAPYGREWADASGSTSAGRHAAHVADYEAWIDLLAYHTPAGPVTSTAYTGPGPLPGRASDGSHATAPGFVTFDLWVGFWKDLDGDGYIGRANPEDPHEGGARPMPDRYVGSNGEWLGVNPGARPGGGGWRIVLTPERDWGPAGVFVARNTDVFTIANSRGDVCPPGLPCLPNGGLRRVSGNDAVVIESRAFGNGRLASDYVLFPQGTLDVPFTACTEPIPVATSLTPEPKSGLVRDCDVIGSLVLPA